MGRTDTITYWQTKCQVFMLLCWVLGEVSQADVPRQADTLWGGKEVATHLPPLLTCERCREHCLARPHWSLRWENNWSYPSCFDFRFWLFFCQYFFLTYCIKILSWLLSGFFFFLAALRLYCYAWAFSSCGEWGLISSWCVQASHCSGFSSCGAHSKACGLSSCGLEVQ